MSCQIKIFFVLTVFIVLFDVSWCESSYERPCHSELLMQCSSTETCFLNLKPELTPGTFHTPNGVCKCRRFTKRNANGLCVPVERNSHPALPTPASVTLSSSSSIAAGVLIPLFLIGVAVLVVLGRRYRWWERLRQPPVRHHDTALVSAQDDTDDDPPIA